MVMNKEERRVLECILKVESDEYVRRWMRIFYFLAVIAFAGMFYFGQFDRDDGSGVNFIVRIVFVFCVVLTSVFVLLALGYKALMIYKKYIDFDRMRSDLCGIDDGPDPIVVPDYPPDDFNDGDENSVPSSLIGGGLRQGESAQAFRGMDNS
jgi:hypothetical protein